MRSFKTHYPRLVTTDIDNFWTAYDSGHPEKEKNGGSKQTQAILKYLERYRELYPEAHFPTVYFVIGRLTSGGTVGSGGLLIGARNSLGKGVDNSDHAEGQIRLAPLPLTDPVFAAIMKLVRLVF